MTNASPPESPSDMSLQDWGKSGDDEQEAYVNGNTHTYCLLVEGCKEKCMSLQDIQKHLKKAHGGRKGKEILTCPSCLQGYNVGTWLKNHVH